MFGAEKTVFPYSHLNDCFLWIIKHYLFVVERLGDEEKLRLFRLIVERYSDLIDEKESKSLLEIRQMVSPYNPVIEGVRESLISDIKPYRYEENFFSAVKKAVDYMKKIKVYDTSFAFWLDFNEIKKLSVCSAIDKAVFFAALLRSFGSDNVVVLVSKEGKPFVSFTWKKERYLFLPESDSLVCGEYVSKVMGENEPAYSFNDITYESFEE